jgi:hypothetical protein
LELQPHIDQLRSKNYSDLGTERVVVISRYNEDTSWAQSVADAWPGGRASFVVYDKQNASNPHSVPFNKGHEASTFLQYVIEYWDALPEWSFMVHADEFSWHHNGSLADRFVDAVEQNRSFVNIIKGRGRK